MQKKCHKNAKLRLPASVMLTLNSLHVVQHAKPTVIKFKVKCKLTSFEID